MQPAPLTTGGTDFQKTRPAQDSDGSAAQDRRRGSAMEELMLLEGDFLSAGTDRRMAVQKWKAKVNEIASISIKFTRSPRSTPLTHGMPHRINLNRSRNSLDYSD